MLINIDGKAAHILNLSTMWKSVGHHLHSPAALSQEKSS